MRTLKVTTVGNSAGVILPKEILERLRVSKGDVLYLVEEPDGYKITPYNKEFVEQMYKITPYNKEFVEQMDLAENIMREDKDVLKVLAK